MVGYPCFVNKIIVEPRYTSWKNAVRYNITLNIIWYWLKGEHHFDKPYCCWIYPLGFSLFFFVWQHKFTDKFIWQTLKKNRQPGKTGKSFNLILLFWSIYDGAQSIHYVGMCGFLYPFMMYMQVMHLCTACANHCEHQSQLYILKVIESRLVIIWLASFLNRTYNRHSVTHKSLVVPWLRTVLIMACLWKYLHLLCLFVPYSDYLFLPQSCHSLSEWLYGAADEVKMVIIFPLILKLSFSIIITLISKTRYCKTYFYCYGLTFMWI